MPELTAEELDRIGGREVVVPYAAPRGELFGFGCLALTLLPPTVLGALGWFTRHGRMPWASGLDFDVIAGLVGLSVSFAAGSFGLWRLGLVLFRLLAGSPGLVAGTRGIRLHGTWVAPQFLAWQDVARVRLHRDGRFLEVVLEPHAQPSSRVVWFGRRAGGSVLVLRVRRAVPIEALQRLHVAGRREA